LKAVGVDAQIVNNDPGAHLKAVYTDHAFDLAIGSPVYRNDPAISTTILSRRAAQWRALHQPVWL